MKKRQKKKNQKKYLPILADEFNLLTMTNEEREQAHTDYEKFRERYAFRKKYSDLKKGKPLYYAYPVGQNFSDNLAKASSVARGSKRSDTE